MLISFTSSCLKFNDVNSMWSLNLKTFCRIYVLGLPNVSLSSMFTVENALEKGWVSSKISRRVYVCNGLIVDGCQRNEISILQMSETYSRSPAKAEVKSNFYNKKTSGVKFKPCMCCMLHVKKILNFLWNIRVFFLLFFAVQRQVIFLSFSCAQGLKNEKILLWQYPASLPT